jgi:DNA-binding GntR family transcriptional regulator
VLGGESAEAGFAEHSAPLVEVDDRDERSRVITRHRRRVQCHRPHVPRGLGHRTAEAAREHATIYHVIRNGHPEDAASAASSDIDHCLQDYREESQRCLPG